MGAVYEVLHVETKRRRALKVMLPSLVSDAEMRARFALEATVTADVESDHLVETFDAGVDPETGVPFLVMELLKGEDLEAVIERRGPLPPAEVVALLRQAARALDQVHAVGVVHRDLKPGNLFLTRREDGAPRLKVLDFGVAKIVAQSTQSMQTTRSLGTPVYMSPEQVEGRGSIDPRADLYSLGHIAYALLTGRPYWYTEARAAEAVYPLLLKVMGGAREGAVARAERAGVSLPPAFDAWFAKATSVSPPDRFATAPEQVEALADALGVEGRRDDRDLALAPHIAIAPPESSDPSRPKSVPVMTTTAAVASTRRSPSGPEPRRRGRRRQVATLAGVGLAALAGVSWIAASTGNTPARGAAAPAPRPDASATPVPAPERAAEPRAPDPPAPSAPVPPPAGSTQQAPVKVVPPPGGRRATSAPPLRPSVPLRDDPSDTR
jgi:serine/threonine-protein kinase